MNQLIEHSIACPYCGELIDVLIDSSENGQEYIEDCQVCCRPIIFSVVFGIDDEPVVTVRSENDTL